MPLTSLHSFAILWHCLILSCDVLFLLPCALFPFYIIIWTSLWDPTLSFLWPCALLWARQLLKPTPTGLNLVTEATPLPRPVPLFTVIWQLSQVPTVAKCLGRERVRSQLWIPSGKTSPKKLFFYLFPLKRYHLDPPAFQRSHLRWVPRFSSASDRKRLALLLLFLCLLKFQAELY